MADNYITKPSRAPVIILFIFLHFVVSSGESESETLLKFRASLNNAGALSNWDSSKSPCNGDSENWAGVLCEKGSIWGLKLENMGLSGVIEVDALSQLQNLRTISLMNNNFDGPLPSFSTLAALKTMYLSNNKFSGQITGVDFEKMESLKKLHLANNQLSGSIPKSLALLPKLMELMLENNQFEGEIPHFPPDRIKYINLANNKLVGEIPNSLSNFSAFSFEGNVDLCGAPLKECNSPSKLSVVTIILVVLLITVATAALVVVVIILLRRSQPPNQPEAAAPRATTAANPKGEEKAAAAIATTTATSTANNLDRMEQGRAANSGSASPEKSAAAVGGARKPEPSVKLTFLRDDREKFDMTDLLKASAEVLGSGAVGSTYKAALKEGMVMVVKRYKHMNNVNREEFHEHMRRLGRLSHPNLLPVVGFYYRKEEKLLVTDYIEKGSLAVHLHGNKSRGMPSPDWPTRLKIIKGVSKGLLYLYKELPSITAPHGHLKSSNVLLDGSYNPLLTDYGLVPVVNQEHAQENLISYKSPEYQHLNRITRKTDLWSFGILILEILTGRFPANFLQQGRGTDADITAWVESVVRDEQDNSVDVFDKDMRTVRNNCHGEMMKLLRLGLLCCDADVERRPEIKEVVEKIKEIKETGDDDGDADDFHSAYGGASEGDRRSSRGLSDDFGAVAFK